MNTIRELTESRFWLASRLEAGMIYDIEGQRAALARIKKIDDLLAGRNI
jgi:hypothetical protein